MRNEGAIPKGFKASSPPVGVTNLGFSKLSYKPARDNPAQPMRVGANDAFKQHSIDHTGISKPYWGNAGD